MSESLRRLTDLDAAGDTAFCTGGAWPSRRPARLSRCVDEIVKNARPAALTSTGTNFADCSIASQRRLESNLCGRAKLIGIERAHPGNCGTFLYEPKRDCQLYRSSFER